ncbi:MAG: hypothetical protein GX896_03190 [Clostridiales bacterium]|nr:hypothetical protein [Clostridiales bacterium]
MHYPKLVPNRVCTTDVKVYQTNGINRDGSPKVATIFEGKCFHNQKSMQVFNADKQLITLAGEVLFNGDIAPNYDVISGNVKIGEREYKINASEKAKNLDGTVNFTRLELI